MLSKRNTDMKSLKQQNGFTIMEGVIVLIVILIVVGGIWYLIHNSKGNKSHIDKAINNTTTHSTTSQ